MMLKKKITIDDIAKHANVSISTVSRVMNNHGTVQDKYRTAVLASIEELGYQPNLHAKGLASGNTMTIGVIMQVMTAPLYSLAMRGILDATQDTGYYPLFADGDWPQATQIKTIQQVLGRGVDGLILVFNNLPPTYIQQLSDQLPTVLVGREVEGIVSVAIDNYQAAHDATTYLIDCGHRAIAHLAGPPTHQDAVARLAGYEDALSQSGIGVDRDLILVGELQEESGLLATQKLLAIGKPFSAIFAANDQMAYGARLALARHGLDVPGDISLFGFDDQPHSLYYSPPLTTVRQPVEEMGHMAASALFNMLHNQPVDLPAVKYSMVIRESVSPVTMHPQSQ